MRKSCSFQKRYRFSNVTSVAGSPRGSVMVVIAGPPEFVIAAKFIPYGSGIGCGNLTDYVLNCLGSHSTRHLNGTKGVWAGLQEVAKWRPIRPADNDIIILMKCANRTETSMPAVFACLHEVF